MTIASLETIDGFYKAGVIHRRRPWRSFEPVEYATLEWVDRFNHRRLLAPIGNIPPAETEEQYYDLPSVPQTRRVSRSGTAACAFCAIGHPIVRTVVRSRNLGEYMKIVKLPVGEQAPDDSDCITVERLPDGWYLLECSALMVCEGVDEFHSVAMISGEPYPTYEAAEAAGLAWADRRCVETMHVARLG